MSLYEIAKDALKLAQKADNVELVQKIYDIQSQALDMQDKQFQLNKKIEDLHKEIEHLALKKKYYYESDHKWMINDDNANVKLCPVCLNRDEFESPLSSSQDGYRYCSQCKGTYN
ncbi:MAG: hypothetical protein WCH58_00035 [Candidatus Saccharibacteria bacterium]